MKTALSLSNIYIPRVKNAEISIDYNYTTKIHFCLPCFTYNSIRVVIFNTRLSYEYGASNTILTKVVHTLNTASTVTNTAVEILLSLYPITIQVKVFIDAVSSEPPCPPNQGIKSILIDAPKTPNCNPGLYVRLTHADIHVTPHLPPSRKLLITPAPLHVQAQN